MNVHTLHPTQNQSAEIPLLTEVVSKQAPASAPVVKHPQQQMLTRLRDNNVRLKVQQTELSSELAAVKQILKDSGQLTRQHQDHFQLRERQLQTLLSAKTLECRQLELALSSAKQQLVRHKNVESKLLQKLRKTEKQKQQLHQQVVKLRLQNSRQALSTSSSQPAGRPKLTAKTKTQHKITVAEKLKGLYAKVSIAELKPSTNLTPGILLQRLRSPFQAALDKTLALSQRVSMVAKLQIPVSNIKHRINNIRGNISEEKSQSKPMTKKSAKIQSNTRPKRWIDIKRSLPSSSGIYWLTDGEDTALNYYDKDNKKFTAPANKTYQKNSELRWCALAA